MTGGGAGLGTGRKGRTSLRRLSRVFDTGGTQEVPANQSRTGRAKTRGVAGSLSKKGKNTGLPSGTETRELPSKGVGHALGAVELPCGRFKFSLTDRSVLPGANERRKIGETVLTSPRRSFTTYFPIRSGVRFLRSFGRAPPERRFCYRRSYVKLDEPRLAPGNLLRDCRHGTSGERGGDASMLYSVRPERDGEGLEPAVVDRHWDCQVTGDSTVTGQGGRCAIGGAGRLVLGVTGSVGIRATGATVEGTVDSGRRTGTDPEGGGGPEGLARGGRRGGTLRPGVVEGLRTGGVGRGKPRVAGGGKQKGGGRKRGKEGTRRKGGGGGGGGGTLPPGVGEGPRIGGERIR
ncbi:hypothetical protein FIBSPDRAFT_887206 [Athelia psychrophila]|uniref:Uncharacterized protein n=1 Tax=Athelia psychrophila TaxID=1759441 RepID=A0A166PSP0_9AGAM|nr:hypothetical protein FIBSPDRAFT_887206 [Fibularhizoctonia sp. CBS 109695]